MVSREYKNLSMKISKNWYFLFGVRSKEVGQSRTETFGYT